MVTKLLSTTFSQDSLNNAVVAQTAADKDTGKISTQGFGTQSTVSAWGFWGWLGYRVHTATTLGQQQALFQQLKSELREKYLDVKSINSGMEASARQLNSEIYSAEKTGVFRGTDKKEETSSVVKLAAIERIEAEIDRLSSQKSAFLTPRMIAELNSKAEVQFASITMSGLKGYRPQSTGGRVSDAQTFNPLKDYKSLLKRSQTGSEVIRLTTDSDMSSNGIQNAIESERSTIKLTLAPWESAAIEENVAGKTLAHCLASLKQAYFRADAGETSLSIKEVAFDHEVSKYVESRLIDKTTGRLRDLTQPDFQVLEQLAFTGRSTIGRVERPFDEMFCDAGGTAVHSRYSGFTVEKDVGVIHLINEGTRHAAMYIETLDPERNTWVLNKVDFGYTASDAYLKLSVTQKLRDETLLPGYIKVSEGTVTHRASGQEDEYEMRNPDIISQADRNIGASVATNTFGLMKDGKMDDVTSMRLPMADVKKIIETAKAQRKDEKDQMQGNTPLYHLGGRNVSSEDLHKQLMSYKQKKDAAMLELVRIQMLFEQFAEIELTSSAAEAAVQNTWFGFKTPELLQSLRARGLLGALSFESWASMLQDTPTPMAKRLGAIHETYDATRGDSAKLNSMERDLIQEAKRFEQSVQVLLGSSSLSSKERWGLQQLSRSSIDHLLSGLWQDHRAIHQLSQKYENLLKIESLELDLKAARKELEMRRTSKASIDENWDSASRKLAAAMQALKPDGWTKPLTAEALKAYCTDGSINRTLEEFAEAAISTHQTKRVTQHVGIDLLLTRIREKAARHLESESLSSALTTEDFEALADRLSELKSANGSITWGAGQLRTSFLEHPKRFNEYIDDLITAQMSEDDKNSLVAEAEKIVGDALNPLSAAQRQAFEAWQRPTATVLGTNRDDVLTGIRARNVDIVPVGIPAQNPGEEVTELEKAVAALESRYNELSADMIKGVDGYTATDEKGRRAVRAGNCADWVRNMMRLGGVNIEGIEMAPTSSIIPERFNPQDPKVLAQGRYDSFRVGFARAGFKLHGGKAPPSVRDVSAQLRAALRNRDDYLIQPRRHGVQYDVIQGR